MKRLIITGFGPFGNFSTNSSGEIVKLFSIEDKRFSIVKKILPVSWKNSLRTYREQLLDVKLKPLLVILLGIHSSNTIHIEYMAWNFKIGKDVDSKVKFGPIKFNFYPWIKTILNLKKVYSVIEDKTNVSISYFAGYYLCNYLYYWALHLSNEEYPVIFIHVPNKGDISKLVRKVVIISRAIIKTYLKLELQI